MTALEFAKRLKQAAPREDDLVHLGLSSEATRRILDQYNCTPHTATKPASGPLLDLVTNFDVSDLVVGLIRFSQPAEGGNGKVVGAIEQDQLIVRSAAVLVRFRESGNEWPVAASEGSFLDALIRFAEDAVGDMVDDRDSSDAALARQADEYAALAGGKQFRPFWASVMLGIDA